VYWTYVLTSVFFLCFTPPGDPLRYHSHFVASVIEAPGAALRPMEIVAHGRLGTGTKKAHILCEWNDETKVVSYFSVEWAGFG
jgi:tRNA-splicing endonuclease subunit Sen34